MKRRKLSVGEAVLWVLTTWAFLAGCVPSAVKNAAREVGEGLPLYMQGVAPASTLTPAERAKVELLGRKLSEVAQRLREAGE